MNKKGWLVVVGICAVCIFAYIMLLLPQDVMFYNYKKAFKEIQHPTDTQWVSAHSYMGVIDPVRPGYKEFDQACDIIVGEVREYSNTKESVKSFYADETFNFPPWGLDDIISFPMAVAGQNDLLFIFFLPVDSDGQLERDLISQDEALKHGPWIFYFLRWLRSNQRVKELKPLGSYYFVGFYGMSFTNFDFRCQIFTETNIHPLYLWLRSIVVRE